MDVDHDEAVETEEQFWDELDDIVSTPCRTHDRIDDTLRTWLSFLATNKGILTGAQAQPPRLTDQEPHITTENAVLRISYGLLSSSLYTKNDTYIRRQITYILLQEDDPLSIHLAAGLLLLEGRSNEETFELINGEGAFSRIVHLVKEGVDDDLGLHRQLLELLYEMSRIQQIAGSHLVTVDDDFVLYLLRIIESLSNDAGDPYHYPVIRTLLVLNEQYMVSTHDPNASGSSSGAITNRVIKVLSIHGNAYKTFGENIILLLNRESETSLQLLILKLLYLIFTTPQTYEYFYTNDLYVLIDILIRNLLDLPAPTVLLPNTQTNSLWHTYLRVLHPLLAHTQLSQPPHYKRDEVRRTLHLVTEAGVHFEKPDDTTIRLAGRCLSVPWLVEENENNNVDEKEDETDADAELTDATTHDPRIDSPPVPRSGAGTGQQAVARRALGLQLPEAQESSLSVQEIASQKEKPGVLTPSKGRQAETAVTKTLEDPNRMAAKSPFDDA